MKDKFKGILIGMMIGLSIAATSTYAINESIQKNLEYRDIKVVLDDNEVLPMDANGKYVEPFIIDGTTYLPVRAIANAMGMDVNWDGDSNTVILKSRKGDEDMTLSEIWNIENKNNFVIEMSMYLAQKCEYGDKIEALNEKQRVIYITQAVEMEVNNGGFAQYFFNSSGDFANEIVDAYRKIGAEKTAKICEKAISIYGGEVPKDRAQREDVLTADDENIDKLLEECDNKFFEYEDDLIELSYEYIMNNKEHFID